VYYIRMKLEKYKRSILVTGSKLSEYKNKLVKNFQGKPHDKGVVVSKKYLNKLVELFDKERLYIDKTFKEQRASIPSQPSHSKFKQLSDPELKFYVSDMFAKGKKSTWSKNILKSRGYTKERILAKKEVLNTKYLAVINNIW
jgi:hypothetical protein